MSMWSRLLTWSSVGDRSAALGELGLLLHEVPQRLEYEVSPTNAYAFASTGGDGVAFSLLDLGHGLLEDTPVVMTVPMAFGDELQPNWIVGQDLREFLGLGLDTGYFVLEQLAYDSRFPDEIEGARGHLREPVLDELAAEFSLTSWSDVRGRLAELSDRYRPSVLLSEPERDLPGA
jgi:hypothetical protein